MQQQAHGLNCRMALKLMDKVKQPSGLRLSCKSKHFLVTPIFTPIFESLYPFLPISLLTFGLLIAAYLFIYEVTASKLSKSLLHELLTSSVASLFWGVWILFPSLMSMILCLRKGINY
ncbi:hypothetical protein KP509_01G119000 [Ceratopteris richardii]|uniref:Dolichyl-diphosphooligosaccharide-protein glycosyltransferase subunit OST5 n=1 Tax=Ceratopteris richardii TaxID=49495 RepID=A0A8T2VQF4_CERRI|nr:hypothetical protein KP509_01G119000 [Ceratopteris richardii]